MESENILGNFSIFDNRSDLEKNRQYVLCSHAITHNVIMLIQHFIFFRFKYVINK